MGTDIGGPIQGGGSVRHQFVRSWARIGACSFIASTLIAFALLSASATGAGTQGASAPGVTSSAIKIGIISDLTGPAASTFEDTPAAMEARFKAQNAAGGVDGRKITWVVGDTTSSPSGAETAAKELVQSQGVFEIAEVSALLFGAAPRTSTPQGYR